MFRLSHARARWLLMLVTLCGCSCAARTPTTISCRPSRPSSFPPTWSTPHTVVVDYAIADGYYMYRERFKFAASGAKLGAPAIPPGKVEFDETFNKNVETYHHGVADPHSGRGQRPVHADSDRPGLRRQGPVLSAAGRHGAAGGRRRRRAAPQMSAAARPGRPHRGSRLPGQPRAAQVEHAAGASGAARRRSLRTAPAPPHNAPRSRPPPRPPNCPASPPCCRAAACSPSSPPSSCSAWAWRSRRACCRWCRSCRRSSSARARRCSRARGFVLSLAYSLGHGDRLHRAGRGRRPGRRRPGRPRCRIRGCWAPSRLLIAAMALSMFGVYQLQVPAALQTRLANASGRQASGKLAGVFVMGAISALIVGPCVAAPLAGALVYISQTRDVRDRRRRAVRDGDRHERAAAAGRRVGRLAAAARRHVDGSRSSASSAC